MRIKVINPNTTAGMTATIAAAARAAASPGDRDRGRHLAHGPGLDRGPPRRGDERARPAEEIRQGEAEGVDGYVIACFGDPGLLAARELARGPGARHRRGRHARGELLATGSAS